MGAAAQGEDDRRGGDPLAGALAPSAASLCSAAHIPLPRRAQDKACIDQIDPVKKEKGINCLPIFLAGCQTLLIVAGPTYCSRMWCVMEIFTFMRMGGT